MSNDKSPKLVYHPFCEIEAMSRKALRAMRFRFTALDLDLTKEGWLRLYVAWGAKRKEEWRTKYPRSGVVSSGWGGHYVELEFPEVAAPYGDDEYSKDHKATIEVGIQANYRNGRNADHKIEYSYKFIERTKYSALVWFAPPNWNDGEGEKVLFGWREKKNKKAKNKA